MPHQCTQCGTTFADGSKEMLSGCPDCGNNKFQYHPGEVEDPPTSGGADADASSADGASAGSPSAGSGSSRDADSRGGSTGSGGGGVTDRVNRATKTVREWVGTDRDGSSGGTDGPGGPGDRSGGGRSEPSGAAGAGSATPEAASAEDTAQASARSDVVDPDELPERQTPPEASTDASADATAGAAGTASTGTESQPSTDDASSAGGSTAGGQEAAATPDGAETPDGAGDTEAAGSGGDENVVEAPEEDTPDLDELRQELNQQFESIKIVEPGQYELNLMELYDREEYIISLKEDGRYAIEVPETWRDDDV